MQYEMFAPIEMSPSPSVDEDDVLQETWNIFDYFNRYAEQCAAWCRAFGLMS